MYFVSESKRVLFNLQTNAVKRNSLRLAYKIYFSLRAHLDSNSSKFYSSVPTLTRIHQNSTQFGPLGLGIKLSTKLVHSD